MKTSKMTILLSLTLLFGVTNSLMAQEETLIEEFPELGLPILKEKSFQQNPVEISVECSQTTAGAIEVTIDWLENQKSLENFRLDVSVFKNGFEQNLYGTIWPIHEGSKSRMVDPGKFRGQAALTALDLKMLNISRKQEKSNNLSVTLTGLEPGINYYWRVLKRDRRGWIGSEVIRIKAPVCPVDYIDNK